ncbi:MAG: RNA polymerase sigma factor [Longimicrobiales bacterium]
MREIARQAAELATTEDDASLLTRARSGDREATERLIGRYVRDVYETAARVLGDRDLANDAAQDAFVNALGALHRFRGESSFRTWLLRIAVNSARSVARRRFRRRETTLEVASEVPADVPDEAQRLAVSQEAQRIEELLPKLPEKQRMAVVLRLQQGSSYEEVAAALDCSEGAARVNYHLGVKRLREWMK